MSNRRKKMPMVAKVILAILVLFIAVTGFIFYREYTRETVEGNPIEIKIEEGTSTRDLVAQLKKEGVIHVQIPFYVKLYMSKSHGKLRYGTYQLNDGMSLDDVIAALEKGGKEEEDTIILTIPEGYSAEMIAQRLEELDIMTAQEFLDALNQKAEDCKYTDLLPSKDEVNYPLQGYLFPETYHLSKGITAEKLIDLFLEEFEKQFDEECQKKAKEMGMSITEVLTRASLVQKETDKVSEYKTIAGVINNRLKENMRLQFDSTVVYAKTDGLYGMDRVMYSDLEYDSPYNTYKYDGLPAGPICNPGKDAIDAVLNPENHRYLFFQTDMVKNDGSNLFFETYEEHQAASSTANRGAQTTEAVDGTTEATTTTESATTEATTSTQNTTEQATQASTEE